MPKLFPIHIEVEEAFVGQVIRRLNAMPGVAKFNFDMMAKRIARAATNGDGTPRKNTGMRFEKTGQEFITGLLAKRPMSTKDLRAAFEADGRSPKSVSSQLFTMKSADEIRHIGDNDDWGLTKKVKDRLRHRKK